MNHPAIQEDALAFVAMLVALVASLVAPPAHAATPYEAQIGGFMTATLQTLITGEFAGRSPSNADASLHRRVCKPDDYEDLRAAANDRAAFDAFRRRCKLVEETMDATHVHSTAYLPQGYCEKLKSAFEKKLKSAFEKPLAEQVYGEQLARGAQMEVTCQNDGAIRVSAPRKQPRALPNPQTQIECPSHDFDKFLAAFSENLQLQETFTQFPLEYRYEKAEETGRDSRGLVWHRFRTKREKIRSFTELPFDKSVMAGVFPSSQELSSHGLRMAVEHNAKRPPSRDVVVKIVVPDSDMHTSYYFYKAKDCWMLRFIYSGDANL